MTSPEQQALPMTVPFARLLLANGDPDGAAMLLNQHLSSLDPDNAPCDRILLEAASLYSDITGDPRWTRYTVRTRLHLPPPRPVVPSPRRAEPDTASSMSGPADEPPGLHRPHGDVRSTPDSTLVLLHEAQTAHWQGRCGEAIHTATRAVDLWHSQRHSSGGTTLLLWLAAMLCACRRDLEAEALLLTNGRLLPTVGSPNATSSPSTASAPSPRSPPVTTACARAGHPCRRWPNSAPTPRPKQPPNRGLSAEASGGSCS